jgi:uncharacterized repeat protein (TIGR01451 family)
MMKQLTGLLLAIPFTVMAQVTLETDVHNVELIQAEDGSVSEQWNAVDKIAPGDQVGYRIHYSNNGNNPASGITINNPIPNDTILVANSVSGQNTSISYSIDGKDFAALNELTITEDGKTRTATSADIQHIRWVVNSPVDAGKAGSVQFKVKVK